MTEARALACERCQTPFLPCKKGQRFCTRSCAATATHHDVAGRNNPNWKGGKAGLFCQGCGTTFTVPPLRADKARFCTLECWNRWQQTHPVRGERIERTAKPCAWCQQPMLLRPKDRRVCCSGICRSKWRLTSMVAKGTAYTNARGGKRIDLNNQYFRSSWEANYARYLNFLKAKGLIEKWEYEADTFWFGKIKRGARSYTPDFRITQTNGARYYVEVKGWMDAQSKTRLKRMAKYHPTVEVRVVAKKEYQEIAKKISGAIPNWEKVA